MESSVGVILGHISYLWRGNLVTGCQHWLHLFFFFYPTLAQKKKTKATSVGSDDLVLLEREAGMGYSKLGTQAQQEYHSPSLSPGCHLVWAAQSYET